MNHPLLSHEKHEQRQSLQREIVGLLGRIVPAAWKMPVLEITAKPDPTRRSVSMTGRIFNLSGEEEGSSLPAPLIQAIIDYHRLCDSFGEAWKRCQVTINAPEEGRIIWNFSY